MATEKNNALREQAASLPLLPGVYQFVDAGGTVLYVGKAKSLRKRVANYFADSRLPSKIRLMVRRAVEIRHIVTDSETDALLLENSLIKTLQPRYNAMLKDDKTYPWIVVRNEPFPRIRSTRQVVRDGSAYFGPYASIGVQKNLLEILHAIFMFRTCSLNLAPDEIAKGKYRPCLEHHLGNCKAPCIGKQSAGGYDESVEMARAMLRGELAPVRRTLTAAMKEAAAELRFESAAIYKHRLDLLENYSSRSVVSSATTGNLDVFALVVDEDAAWCNFVRIAHGNIVNSFTVQLSLGAEDDPRTILTTAISRIVEKNSSPSIGLKPTETNTSINPSVKTDGNHSEDFNNPALLSSGSAEGTGTPGYSAKILPSALADRQDMPPSLPGFSPTTGLAKEIIVPFPPEEALFPGLKFTVPKRGEKLKLLEFAEKNARMYRAEQLKNLEIKDPEKAVNRVMDAMQRELHLDRRPHHIECFDNSNLQGTHPVASCVVFRDGKPSRKEYRHFNVKTVEGPDDFASMREIVRRRYTRLLEEEKTTLAKITGLPSETGSCNAVDGICKEIYSDTNFKTKAANARVSRQILPDLVIVDGGKGQLSAAYSIFQELEIADRVSVVGLAERYEEVFFPADPMPYYLKRNGEPLKVMMHIRDEAHRFGITFHRNKRSADFIRSELELILGIGPKSIEQLLRTFKTVAAVRAASPEALAEVVGPVRAAAIRDYFAG